MGRRAARAAAWGRAGPGGGAPGRLRGPGPPGPGGRPPEGGDRGLGRRGPERAARAAGGGGGQGPRGGGDRERWFEALVKKELDADGARKVQERLDEMGVKDPETLRGLFRTGSTQVVLGRVLTLFLNLLAIATCVSSRAVAEDSLPPGPPRALAYLLLSFGLFFFAIDAVAELSTIGLVLVVNLVFGLNAEAYLRLVNQVAGSDATSKGLGSVNRVKAALDIVTRLNAIIEELKSGLAGGGAPQGSDNTLENLSALLLMNGVDSEGFGLSEKEASKIARVFNRFDLNGDAVLQPEEIKAMSAELGQDLSDADVATAMEFIDVDANGEIEFEEFLAWWTGTCGPYCAPEEGGG